MPQGLLRTTGETLMLLIAQSSDRIRLAAPFIDLPAISFLADALAAATTRAVAVEILVPTRSTHAEAALEQLVSTIRTVGDPKLLSFGRLRFDAPWAHLKVLSCDSIAAYIGSANVTGAGLAGPNLELGVLVRGPSVSTVDRVLDLYVDTGRG
jgi:phosphatidylserine/phosphatidylglycerophosphate/cardiolipin synthase-like enzyme